MAGIAGVSEQIAIHNINVCRGFLNRSRTNYDRRFTQVRAYLDMTGAEHGLIVLMTTGAVIAVSPSPLTMAA